MAFDYPAIVDKIDVVPESYRGLYQEKDGKFALDGDLAARLDTTGLKTQLSKAQKEAKERRESVERWEKFGKTPEEIENLLKEQEKKLEEDAGKKGEWDKLKDQIMKKHKEQLDAKDAENVKMRSSLEKYLVESAATSVIAEQKGVPTLLLPHVKSSVKVVEENGEFRVRVVGADGSPRVNDKGDYLTIKDLVLEMKADPIFGRAFEADGTSGGGSKTNTGGGGSKNNSNLSPVERLKAARRG